MFGRIIAAIFGRQTPRSTHKIVDTTPLISDAYMFNIRVLAFVVNCNLELSLTNPAGATTCIFGIAAHLFPKRDEMVANDYRWHGELDHINLIDEIARIFGVTVDELRATALSE